MASQSLMLQLPEELYRRLESQARLSHRTVEDEVLRVVASSVSPESALPAGLESELGQLEVLSDAALWQTAKSHLSSRDAARMESLHSRRQRDGLTPRETNTLAELVRRYERIMVIRARAAALLQQRGHDVNSLLP